MTENNNIPKHWRIKSLREVCLELQSGKRPKGGVQGIDSGVPSIGAEHLNTNGGFKFEKIKFVPKKFAEQMNKGVIKRDDVIIVKDGATTGKTSFVGKDFPFDFAVINEHVFIVRFTKDVLPKFGFYKLFSSIGQKEILEDFRGAAQGGISSKFIDNVSIPLPSLPEQHAIVSKIEELFSELDKGKQQLETARQQLKTYRQSLLKWAFENSDFPEYPIKEITERIQIGPFGTQLHKHDYVENGIPLINPMHIQEGKIVANNSYSIKEEKKNSLPNYILRSGDIIMGRRGEMGRCGLVTDKEDGWFCGTGSLYFRPNLLKLDSAYLYYYLSSEPTKKYLEENAGGTTMANLNLKIVNSIPVKLPSLNKQKEIVQELESKLTVCDKLEETITQSLQQAETLRQSILKKAFEGKLVTAVAEQREAKVIPLYQPKNEYFYQMQLLGLVAKTSKQKQIEHGEMTLAKYAYLMDKVYDVPTYFNYNRWHLGPYPPTIKKVINNKQYFKKSGNHIEVLNEKTLFNSTNPYTEKIRSAVNDLADIFSKYTAKERSHKTELLATVCKVIEDIQSTDLKAVRQSMAEWKIDLKGEKHTSKADKFSELETEKCLTFINEKGWDKKLMK